MPALRIERTLMQDSKDTTFADEHATDGGSETMTGEAETSAGVADKPTDHWQKYRRWISKAPAPRSRRSGIDPSLYTWKGYRSWSEQVKRNWSDN